MTYIYINYIKDVFLYSILFSRRLVNVFYIPLRRNFSKHTQKAGFYADKTFPESAHIIRYSAQKYQKSVDKDVIKYYDIQALKYKMPV